MNQCTCPSCGARLVLSAAVGGRPAGRDEPPTRPAPTPRRAGMSFE
jgi:hypothetical protein